MQFNLDIGFVGMGFAIAKQNTSLNQKSKNMNMLNLIKGKKSDLSLHEKVAKHILNLSEKNKTLCLELIMQMQAEERLLFLNAYVNAVATLKEAA